MDGTGKNRSEVGPNDQTGGRCCGDPYASLPAELRPKPAAKNDGLRHVTCPGCGMIYRTNRKTDLCLRCEQESRS
jgi:hypothetical protein